MPDSFVYLIRDGGAYKIGKSRFPLIRLRAVASSDGVIVHLIPSANPFQVEHALHRRFASLRIRGRGREWFNLSQDDVDTICRIGPTVALDDLLEDAERIRLIVDTEDVIRRAVQLRKVKNGTGETVSEVVNTILREALAEEIRELEQHAKSEGRKRKKEDE